MRTPNLDLDRAARLIDDSLQLIEGETEAYRYWDEAMSRWYRISPDDVSLALTMDDDGEYDYSLWCAATTAREEPRTFAFTINDLDGESEIVSDDDEDALDAVEEIVLATAKAYGRRAGDTVTIEVRRASGFRDDGYPSGRSRSRLVAIEEADLVD